MVNTRKPFIYSLEHKLHGTPQTTATVLVNNGVHQLTGASTWILAQPRVGSLVTIYAAATMSTANITIVSTSTGGQVAFNSLGGTQKLVLSPSTVGGGRGPLRDAAWRVRHSVAYRQCVAEDRAGLHD